MAADTSALTIGDLASRAGIGEGTLRMWEARYGFPSPRRLPSGHRRYSERDLGAVVAVLRARADGLPLPMAIELALRREHEPRPSVYGALRERFEHLHPQLLQKPAMTWLSHAIEDECGSRVPRPLLFAAFQHERFYRQAQSRWRDLCRGAEHAFVLADFAGVRRRSGSPTEVPIDAADPLMREWVIVCEGPQVSACMVAWERPRERGQPRTFETIWTVEPAVVREAARVCCALVARALPDAVADLPERLALPPEAVDATGLRAAVEVATRVIGYASAAHGS